MIRISVALSPLPHLLPSIQRVAREATHCKGYSDLWMDLLIAEFSIPPFIPTITLQARGIYLFGKCQQFNFPLFLVHSAAELLRS